MPKKELPKGWEEIKGERKLTDDEFRTLATSRSEARRDKNFKEADRILNTINEGGWWIEDAPDGGYSFGPMPEATVERSLPLESNAASGSSNDMVSVLRPRNPGRGL